jgi:hypothetical protein
VNTILADGDERGSIRGGGSGDPGEPIRPRDRIGPQETLPREALRAILSTGE